MASLYFKDIHVHPEATMDYICDPEKMIPGHSSDVNRVIDYMGNGGPERVYSIGHHCSANPQLARQQFAFHRARYHDYKGGAGVQGCGEGKSEVLAKHFFLSYTEDDPVTPEIMDKITCRLLTETKLRNFPSLAANHHNTENEHTHIVTCQYSVGDKPCKLAMKSRDFDDISRHLNHICYEYGLSIIDHPRLRKDPEYNAWIDSVIAEGKVRIHPYTNVREQRWREEQEVKNESDYERWVRVKREIAEREQRAVEEEEARKREEERRYYYSPYCVDNYNRPHYIPMYRNDGTLLSLLQALYCLAVIILDKDARIIDDPNEILNEIDPEDLVDPPTVDYTVRTPWRLQSALDALHTANKLEIKCPADIAPAIAKTGKQMNALKVEMKRHETRLASGDALYNAITAYQHFRPMVEGVENPPAQSKDIYDQAYHIMAMHKCTTDAQVQEFLVRRQFSEKKTQDYEKRLGDLKKQYRNLKKLEAISNDPWEITGKPKHNSLDSVIGAAERQRGNNQGVRGNINIER